MKGEGSWVFGSGNKTRRNKDGRRKGERYLELADFRVCLLQRIPRGCSMGKGKGHDVNDQLRRSDISQCLM